MSLSATSAVQHSATKALAAPVPLIRSIFIFFAKQNSDVPSAYDPTTLRRLVCFLYFQILVNKRAYQFAKLIQKVEVLPDATNTF